MKFVNNVKTCRFFCEFKAKVVFHCCVLSDGISFLWYTRGSRNALEIYNPTPGGDLPANHSSTISR